jgi:aminoglycoside phosphotransferase (APT) family kinase protein
LQSGDGVLGLNHEKEWSVVHGDLNPGNVIISAGGQIALIDFRDSGVGHWYEDCVTLEC